VGLYKDGRGSGDRGSGAGKAGLDRRAALRTLASGAIGVATSSMWVDSLSALASQQAHAHAAQAAIAAKDWAPRVLNGKQNETVIVLTELIIPQTDTPGAKSARVNRFIDAVLQEAEPLERDTFLRGLAWIDERSQMLFKKDFTVATATEQGALLTTLSNDTSDTAENRLGVQFFRAIKSMTIDGYYTSEFGLTQELGDNGQLFLPQFAGCDHPEHQ
jgi:hypothetical protein